MYLGIDWGGTYIKAGLVNNRGKIVKKRVYVSADFKKKQVFIDKIKWLAESFSKFKIKGIGIGAPGIINIKKGFIYYLPNIPGWKNYPLQSILRERLKLPVFINNDANLFALAESRLGAAKDKSRAIFLTLGTGLGGAVTLDGKILQTEVSAAELGHIPISLSGRRCSCGGQGCVETFLGASFLLARYKQLKKNKANIEEVKEIFDKALAGEKEALIVWKEFSKNLGRFLAGMVNVFNPQVIVLGGGVAGAFRLFKPLVWQVIKEQAMWPQIKNLKLVKAKLKDAGIIGAALLAREKEEG